MSNEIKNENLYTIKALLKLDLRSRFGFGSKIGAKNIGKWIANVIFTGAIYGIIVAGIYYLTKMFTGRPELRDSYIVLVTMASMILQLIICTATLVKALYYSTDNEMLMRFPVNGTQIFAAKSAYVLTNNFLIMSAMLLPFYICYGVLMKLGVGFYFWAGFVTIISSTLPFFIANIIAIPVMLFVNLIKNKFGIVLAIIIAVLIFSFTLYMLILNTVLDYMQTRELSLFSPQMIEHINNFAKYCFPFNQYGNLLRGKKVLLSLLYVILLTSGVGAISFWVVKKWYFKTILDGIENQRASFTKKIKNKPLPVFVALLKREFLLIIRSFNYSFQYLAMAMTAPIMVFMCNKLAAKIGVESVGTGILPGISLLVVTIFVAIIISFSSTAISREGSCFYHTKIIPVSYNQQILVKFILYSAVATISVILCCLSILFAKFISFKDSVFIFFIAELVVITLTSICIYVDTISPSFNVSGEGEIVSANKNVAIALVVGLLLAIIYGFSTMILSYLPSMFGIAIKNGLISIYWLLIIITAVTAAISVTTLFVNVNKRYTKLVQA
ncbi:MAG: hypothetical protein RR033_02115 [Clostridia bacterium]